MGGYETMKEKEKLLEIMELIKDAGYESYITGPDGKPKPFKQKKE